MLPQLGFFEESRSLQIFNSDFNVINVIDKSSQECFGVGLRIHGDNFAKVFLK